MRIKMDSDVQLVAEFMQRSLPPGKLLFVATALNELAMALWGHNHPDFNPEMGDAPLLSLEDEPEDEPGSVRKH